MKMALERGGKRESTLVVVLPATPTRVRGGEQAAIIGPTVEASFSFCPILSLLR